MSRFWRLRLLIIATSIASVFSACGPRKQTSSGKSVPSASISNTFSNDGSVVSQVVLTNGLSIVVDEHKLTVYFQTDNTLTAWFDPVSKKLLKTLLETPGSQKAAGQWVTDFNADGVPDARRIKGQPGSEIYFDGHWYRCTPAGGTNTFIHYGNRRITLFYDGTSWTESPGTNF